MGKFFGERKPMVTSEFRNFKILTPFVTSLIPNFSKNKPKGGPKHKIAYYEAKWDFKVPKIHSWVVKLVCYLKESARSIFSTTVRL